MSKEKRRVPKLRFPGFTEDWEQRKLGKCVDISTGYPFDSQDFNENGEYLVITNGNIQENTPFVLNNVGNRIDLDDSLKKYILDIDDLLITMDGTVGRVAIVVNNKLVLAQRVCRIKSNEPYYIYQLLSKNNFIQSMNKIGHGGTIKHISLSEISEYQDFYPKSQKERIKISTVLTNCDKLITLHQRKLNNIKLKKKALLQKLFPKNGERYPELRFPGFTDAWEQRKLDDIAKIKTGGGTPKTANPEYWSGNIPWIQSSDLVEGDIVHVNINKFINNNALKNSAAKLISRDSIALVTRVGVGKVAVINQDFTTSQDFLSLSDFDGSDIKFLAYQLYRLMQENAKVLQGTSIKGITKTELIEQSISIPSSGQEQNLISAVLSKIDSIITLHQRKLEHLQLQKKALLQQMFV